MLGTKAPKPNVFRVSLGFSVELQPHTDSRAQLWGAPTSHGLGEHEEIRVCPEVSRGDLPGPGEAVPPQPPGQGGNRAGWERHGTSRPSSGSFQSKFLSHRSGSDS